MLLNINFVCCSFTMLSDVQKLIGLKFIAFDRLQTIDKDVNLKINYKIKINIHFFC